MEDDEDRVGEGGLTEGGEESAGEKGGEERVPSDDREVIILRPFLESGGSMHFSTRDQCDCGGIAIYLLASRYAPPTLLMNKVMFKSSNRFAIPA